MCAAIHKLLGSPGPARWIPEWFVSEHQHGLWTCQMCTEALRAKQERWEQAVLQVQEGPCLVLSLLVLLQESVWPVEL